MANLTNTAQLVKKTTPILLILLTISFLAFAIYLRYSRSVGPSLKPPAPPTIEQDSRQKQPQGFEFSTITTPDVPKSLPIFVTDRFQFAEQINEFAKFAARNFNFLTDPQIVEETIEGRQLTWTDANRSLSINPNLLIYTNNIAVTPEKILQENELEGVTLSEITKIPINTSGLSLNTAKTRYLALANDRFVSRSPFEDAQVVEFNFDQKLGGLFLMNNNPTSSYVTVRIRKDGVILLFQSLLTNHFQQQSGYLLKSPGEAINEIRTGQGTVVYTVLLDENGQALELFRVQPFDIQLATITSLSLAYLLPKNTTELIQPIYVFEGSFQHQSSDNGKVVIYLPAIKIGD